MKLWLILLMSLSTYVNDYTILGKSGLSFNIKCLSGCYFTLLLQVALVGAQPDIRGARCPLHYEDVPNARTELDRDSNCR